MKPKPEWFTQADTALKRAAESARQIARLTNTAMHVMRNGKIVKLMPAQDKAILREDIAHYGEESK